MASNIRWFVFGGSSFLNRKRVMFAVRNNNANVINPEMNLIPRKDAYSMASAGVV